MPSTKHRTKSPVNLLLPYTFLCTIGPSVTAATALFIVRTLMCRYEQERHGHSLPEPGDAVCSKANVGALTASALAAMATLDGIFSFLSTSYVQTLSDRVGRRPLLIALPIFATIATSSMILAYAVPNTHLAWVLLAANGIFISASTKSIFVPTLCVADVATEVQRTRFYSRLEAVSLLGPGIAYLLSALASRYIPVVLFPYYIALTAQLLSSMYALVAIPETLKRKKELSGGDDSDSENQEEEESDADDDEEPDTIVHMVTDAVEGVADAVVEPIRPLALLLPHRDKQTGRFQWRLFIITLSLLSTSLGAVFVPTVSLLFLSDKFQFDPEANAWVLAYLTFSRFAYLVFIFPTLQKVGRDVFRKYESKKGSQERAPLLRSQSKKEREAAEQSNHFDVILLFVSVCFDALSLILVSTSQSWKNALIAFAFLALGAGDNPTYKSVFVSSVPEEHATQALAALDMVFNIARLLSPILLGALYAVFAEKGRPELIFLVAGGLCALGAGLLAPLIVLGRRAGKK